MNQREFENTRTVDAAPTARADVAVRIRSRFKFSIGTALFSALIYLGLVVALLMNGPGGVQFLSATDAIGSLIMLFQVLGLIVMEVLLIPLFRMPWRDRSLEDVAPAWTMRLGWIGSLLTKLAPAICVLAIILGRPLSLRGVGPAVAAFYALVIIGTLLMIASASYLSLRLRRVAVIS